MQCPVAVECNLNDPHCLFRYNSNSLVVFVTYSNCRTQLSLLISCSVAPVSEAAAAGSKLPDIFSEISRKCIICYQPNINKKKEFEIIQFVSKPYFSKFHLLTGFMNLPWYSVGVRCTSKTANICRNLVCSWSKNLNIYILRKMEFSRTKYLHIRQRTNHDSYLLPPPPTPPIRSSSLSCFSSSKISEVKMLKSVD